jgi:peptide/nickel transport system ATP-binding protein
MGVTEKIYNRPLHPYTKMLMASVPRLDKKWEEAGIELKAKQADLTSGCVYYARCPVADKALGCDRHRPTLSEVESDHFVACFRYAEG